MQKGFLSFRKNVFILVFLHFLLISLASFLNTSFVYPFFHPFLFLSLLVSLSWLVSSSWIFHSSFFHLPFSPFFTLFSLFCFSLFFWERSTLFLFRISFLLVVMVFGAFLSTFASPFFFVFSTFLTRKKTFVLKSLLFCPFIEKMVFENVLKFDLCHTSPSVFNSCVTIFSFLPRFKNYLLFCF